LDSHRTFLIGKSRGSKVFWSEPDIISPFYKPQEREGRLSFYQSNLDPISFARQLRDAWYSGMPLNSWKFK